ncbi:MAG TPA: prepilin-type N-terminal cleavage/methylation domain-containing protein [Pyrinomonadaceae bacterium]|jgi:prepilin-type N-terminal cleavage/methylation domain-containing protein
MSRGFSMVELLIVLTVITILLGISLFYLSGHERLLRPDEEALKIIDVFQEARQRSLTQRETMRVEIDLTDNMARLIDENLPGSAGDDRAVRSVVLVPQAEVKLDSRPPDISTNPTEMMSVPAAQFRPSVYPSSTAHNVCTFRFLRNGTVVNEGTDALGSNATTTGLTLFIWSPKPNSTTESEIARAITVIGATGSVRFWEYNRSLSDANKWKDSRRMSIYGGTAGGSNTAPNAGN